MASVFLIELYQKEQLPFDQIGKLILGYAYGWPLHIQLGSRGVKPTKETTLRNFLLQATGAEILRLFCCLAVQQDIKVCAPVHDAVLIEAPVDKIDAAVATTQNLMRQAGEIILAGFQLRSEAKVFRYPDRYTDPRGVAMWETVKTFLESLTEDTIILPEAPSR
jgi:hypothetical protein